MRKLLWRFTVLCSMLLLIPLFLLAVRQHFFFDSTHIQHWNQGAQRFTSLWVLTGDTVLAVQVEQTPVLTKEDVFLVRSYVGENSWNAIHNQSPASPLSGPPWFYWERYTSPSRHGLSSSATGFIVQGRIELLLIVFAPAPAVWIFRRVWKKSDARGFAVATVGSDENEMIK